MMKSSTFLILVAAFIGYLFLSNDDLQPNQISSGIPYRPEWVLSSLNENEQARVNEILKQPFIYLDEGGQSYVFESRDGKYVLKLFKFKRFRPYFFVKILPDISPFKSFRDKHFAARMRKLTTVFSGYKVAYEYHRKESGLLAVQLNYGPKSMPITVVDKSHHERQIDLKPSSFVLQEKGEMLSTYLSQILDQGNLQKAEATLNELFDLYLSEYSKGIYDLDHGVIHNIGIKNGRLFHLDVGKLTQDERIKSPAFYTTDLKKVIGKLHTWLNKKYPQYAQELNTYLDKRLESVIAIL